MGIEPAEDAINPHAEEFTYNVPVNLVYRRPVG